VILNVIVPTPPDAETGDTKAASTNLTRVTVGVSRLVVSDGAVSTVRVKVLKLV
jgi:hypothetical protein